VLRHYEKWYYGQEACKAPRLRLARGVGRFPRILELELIQTRMIQKPLLWVEVGKSACVVVILLILYSCISLARKGLGP
jgi:hypothetical protein